MIFVRGFIGGPLANSGPWLVGRRTRIIHVVDGPDEIGHYVFCNLGWTWHQ